MSNILSEIIKEYELFPQVAAIAIGGSSSANTADSDSDIDIYVFTKENIPVDLRKELVQKISSKYEVGGEYFGAGDEYFADGLNKQLDVMFWDINWFADVVANTWERFYPSNGYSTAFLYTLSVFNIVYDPNNWLYSLQNKIKTAYPLQLRQNIITRNVMLMCDKPFASYYEQIEKAVKRGDVNSVNHRVTAFLASYFDVIFAVNELLHPGEKRLVQYCKNNCKILPEKFEENIEALLNYPAENKLEIVQDIIKNLRKIL